MPSAPSTPRIRADPNVKMRLLLQLKDKADVVLCIYAGDIERKKVRADFGITYDRKETSSGAKRKA